MEDALEAVEAAAQCADGILNLAISIVRVLLNHLPLAHSVRSPDLERKHSILERCVFEVLPAGLFGSVLIHNLIILEFLKL